MKLKSFNLTGKAGFKEFVNVNGQHIVKCASINVPKVNGFTYEYVSTWYVCSRVAQWCLDPGGQPILGQ